MTTDEIRSCATHNLPSNPQSNSLFNIHSFLLSFVLFLHTMGKSDAEVIAIFNEQVNMTADELEAWLDDTRSREAGTGVGIESGRRIVEILCKNPERKPE